MGARAEGARGTLRWLSDRRGLRQTNPLNLIFIQGASQLPRLFTALDLIYGLEHFFFFLCVCVCRICDVRIYNDYCVLFVLHILTVVWSHVM